MGIGLIFKVFVTTRLQPPLVTVYLIITVPESIPLTLPVASTVAIKGFEDDHTPFNVLLDNFIVEATQTSLGPSITSTTGKGSTVMLILAVPVPQLFVADAVIVFNPAVEKKIFPGIFADELDGLPSGKFQLYVVSASV